MLSKAIEYVKGLFGNVKIPQWLLGCNNILTAAFMFAGGIYIFQNVFGGFGVAVVFMASKAFLDSKQEAHKTLVRIGRAAVVFLLGYLMLRTTADRMFGSFASLGGRNPILMVAVTSTPTELPTVVVEMGQVYSPCFDTEPEPGSRIRFKPFTTADGTYHKSYELFSEPMYSSSSSGSVDDATDITILSGPVQDSIGMTFWRVSISGGQTGYLPEWLLFGESYTCILAGQ